MEGLHTSVIPVGRGVGILVIFLGDDRVHSFDSRIGGTVPRSSLICAVLLTYWPPNRISVH
jgi:hypothetical protein